MDKSRQKFEAEFKKQYPIQPTDSDVFIKEIAFKFWQASRESLEVELPKKSNTVIAGDIKTKYYFNGINEGIDKCRNTLISNGVKIKNES